MIEIDNDRLNFRFPDIEEAMHTRLTAWCRAKISAASGEELTRLKSQEVFLDNVLSRFGKVQASVSFIRTLRIPDDGRSYPLPPGFEPFPLRHVDDIAGVPAGWRKTGGVALPMHPAEAMWLRFQCHGYPLILRIAAGGICAVSGQKWETGLTSDPQNYLNLQRQPWLDGFRVDEDTVRQFIAMPLGKGLTVESELTGQESWGGLQLQAFPLKLERYWHSILPDLAAEWQSTVAKSQYGVGEICMSVECSASFREPSAVGEMGLGAGGKMRQQIYVDDQGIDAWDRTVSSRCYARLCLAEEWTKFTGEKAPHEPPSAKDYSDAGLPWFSYKSDAPTMTGETTLTGISSVNKLMKQKVGVGLPDNETLFPLKTKVIKSKDRKQVSEF